MAAATVIGLGLNFTPIDPIKALFWAAVINGGHYADGDQFYCYGTIYAFSAVKDNGLVSNCYHAGIDGWVICDVGQVKSNTIRGKHSQDYVGKGKWLY